ncbi:MAG: SMC family ATPase [Deltaproteobacteria bacterium]|nr:SMC family ATPase [Deltaproteobacteria bacterium]
MKINRVELKNYRSHGHGDFSFDRGINLLLGRNGAGKSSILEAAGLALFGADVRSTIEDAVMRGHKSATITVTFEGNDGNTYLVERKIGAVVSFKLYLQGEKNSRIEGKEPVHQKVRELAGVEANTKNLFQNVITASQNKIVDIFSLSKAEREKTFNQIFDTAIYRQIFDGFAKDACSTYQNQRALKNEALEILGGQITDTSALRKTLKDKQAAKAQADGILRQQKKEIDELEKRLKQLEQRKNEITSLNAAAQHKQELAETKQKEQTKSKADLAQSEQAAEIVTKNESAHKGYLETEKKGHGIAAAIEALEKQQAERDRCKDRISKLTTEITANAESQKHLRRLLADKTKEIDTGKTELADLQKNSAGLQKESDDFIEAGKKRSALENSFQDQYGDLKKIQEAIIVQQGKIDELTKNKVDSLKTAAQQKTEQQEKKGLIEKRSKKQNIEKKIGELQTRLSEIKTAETSLSDGKCPFLKEQCLNLKDGTSPADYFLDRRNSLNEAISACTQELSAYDNIDDLISRADAAIAQLASDLERDRNNTRMIDSLTDKNKVAEKELQIISLRIKDLLRPMEHECEQELAANDFEALAHKITDILTTLREQFKHLTARNNEAKKNLAQKTADLDALRRHTGETETELKQLAVKKIELTKEQSSLTEMLKTLDAELQGLAALRVQRKEQLATLAECKPGYDLHVANQQKAQEQGSHKTNIRDLDNELQTISNDLASLHKKLTQLSADFSEETYHKLTAALNEKRDVKEAQQNNTASLQTETAIAEREFNENRKRELEHADLKKQLSLLTRKLELAETFRNNVNGMGKFVADRLIHAITTSATDNFRRITGRSEEIHWVNNEKESYAVFLANGPELEHRKRFEMLSGGEQISVALSLRAAMASALTRANFAVFDEPTINLDAEKKVALAESLQEMLKGLSQAIIVTHDDTFREMAQKTILLTGC